MAWFGDGLSSFTGHLSTLTREVLNEGREEVRDHLAELSIAQQRIQELEAYCHVQKQEVERTRQINSELEERCQAAELQISAVSSQYRDLLQKKEEEIKHLKLRDTWDLPPSVVQAPPSPPPDASSPERGCGFHGDESDFGDLIARQREINRLAAEVRTLRAELEHWRQAARRITAPEESNQVDPGNQEKYSCPDCVEWEKQIKDHRLAFQKTVDDHQQQWASLQDHHSHRLSQLQQAHKAQVLELQERLHFLQYGTDTSDGEVNLEDECNDSSKEIHSLRAQLYDTKKQLQQSVSELERLQAGERQKERQLQLVSRQLEKLQAEKAQLEQNYTDMHNEASSLKNQITSLQSKLSQNESQLLAPQHQITDVKAQSESQSMQEAEKKLEGTEEYLAGTLAHRNKASTRETLEEIGAVRQRLAQQNENHHAESVMQRQIIVDSMVHINEKQKNAKKQLEMLEQGAHLLSKEATKMIKSLGVTSYEDDSTNSIEEFDDSKGLNSEECFQDSKSEKSLPLVASTAAFLCKGDQPVRMSLASSQVSDSDWLDFDDHGSLVSSVSELSVRNKELDEQVRILQQQVEDYERQIDHFELVQADWHTERQAMEDLLLNLRAQLRMKEEALSVATAKQGLIQLKKKNDGTDPLVHVPMPADNGSTSEDELQNLQDDLEELVQGSAQLESERDVLKAEKEGLLQELKISREQNQTLQKQVDMLEMSSALQQENDEQGHQSAKVPCGENLEDAHATYESQILQLTSECDMLEVSLVQLDQQHQEALDRIIAIKTEVESQNKELKRKLEWLQSEVEEKENDNNLLRMEVETVREQLTQMVLPPDKWTQEGSGGPDHGESHSNSIPEMPGEQKSMLKSILSAVETINSDNLALEDKIAMLEKKRTELEQKLLQMEKEKDQGISIIEQQKHELEQLKDTVTSLEMNAVRSSICKGTVGDSRELSEYPDTIHVSALDACIITGETSQDREDIQKHLSGAIAQKMEGYTTEIDRLKKLLEEHQHKSNAYEQLTSKHDALKVSHQKLQMNCEILEALAAENKEMLHKQNQEVVSLKKTVAILENENKELKTSALENKEKMAFYTALEKECSSLKEEVCKQKKHLESLQNNADVSQYSNNMIPSERWCDIPENASLNMLIVNAADSQIMAVEECITNGSCNSCQMVKKNLSEMQNRLRKLEEYDGKFASIIELVKTKEDALSFHEMLLLDLKRKFLDLSEEADRHKHLIRDKDDEISEASRTIKSQQQIIKGLEELCSTRNAEKCDKGPGSVTNNKEENEENVKEFEHGEPKRNDGEILPCTKVERPRLTEDCFANQNVKALQEEVKGLQLEKERMLVVLNEKSRECSLLKAEVHQLMTVVSAEKQALGKLQRDNEELTTWQRSLPDQEMTKEAVQNLSRIIRDKDLEIDALRQKNETLMLFLQQSLPDAADTIKPLLEEREKLSKQLDIYLVDREQLINVLNQKHRECLEYHAEAQKYGVLLATETSKYEVLQQQHLAVSQHFEDKQKSLLDTQNEVIVLKQKVTELEKQQSMLQEKYEHILLKERESSLDQEEDAKLKEIKKLEVSLQEKEKLMYEKDLMIHELAQEVEKQKELVERRDDKVNHLNKWSENAKLRLANLEGQLALSQKEAETLRTQQGNLQSEMALLRETNRRLSMAVPEKDLEAKALQEKVETLTQLLQQENRETDNIMGPEIERLLGESQAMQQMTQQLQRERDETLLALSQRQQENGDLQAENRQQQEKIEHLKRELERLRNHLMEVEESYTREAVSAEEREKELRSRLAVKEEQARMASTAVQNSTQQASIQVQSLQEQVCMVVGQRDRALAQASDLEDKVQEFAASAANLQLVLDQFRKEREREVQTSKRLHAGELDVLRQQVNDLVSALHMKEEQLRETSEALDAASRLSEQLDRKEEIIVSLREEASAREKMVQKVHQDMVKIKSGIEGKVDKQVMKNLVLGYFNASPGQRPEVVRLLARVLDFNQEDMAKAGIKVGKERDSADHQIKTGRNWISSFLGGQPPTVATASPTALSNVVTARSSNASNNKSFFALFVQFLENESQPRPQLRLPAEAMAKELTDKAATQPRRQSLRVNPFNVTPAMLGNSIHLSPAGSLASSPVHPLMQPLSAALPMFAPVSSAETSVSGSSVLEEVLK